MSKTVKSSGRPDAVGDLPHWTPRTLSRPPVSLAGIQSRTDLTTAGHKCPYRLSAKAPGVALKWPTTLTVHGRWRSCSSCHTCPTAAAGTREATSPDTIATTTNLATGEHSTVLTSSSSVTPDMADRHDRVTAVYNAHPYFSNRSPAWVTIWSRGDRAQHGHLATRTGTPISRHEMPPSTSSARRYRPTYSSRTSLLCRTPKIDSSVGCPNGQCPPGRRRRGGGGGGSVPGSPGCSGTASRP
jgi:hypothetical protein